MRLLRRLTLSLIAVLSWDTVTTATALAQFDRIGGSVEFRAPDLPIGAPPLRDPGAVGLPADAKLLDRMGPPSTGDVLKDLDKSLGRTGTKSTEDDRDRHIEPFKPGEDLGKRPPAHSTFK